MTTLRIPFEQASNAVVPKQFESFCRFHERIYKMVEAEAYEQCGWGENRPLSGGVSACFEVDADGFDLQITSDKIGEDVKASLFFKLAGYVSHPDFHELCRYIYDWWLSATEAERESTQWYSFDSQ
jgi:hypothetical protein